MNNHNTYKTHCKWGHEFTPENTQWRTNPNGKPRRQCRICHREMAKAWVKYKRVRHDPRRKSQSGGEARA